MPGVSAEEYVQIVTTKLGSPVVTAFQAGGDPGLALSGTESTVIDFSNITDCALSVPGIPMSCGYNLVDATSGDVVDYGVTVSENAPDVDNVGRWNLRLLVPPVPDSPYVWANVFITYFPFITAPDSFT